MIQWIMTPTSHLNVVRHCLRRVMHHPKVPLPAKNPAVSLVTVLAREKKIRIPPPRIPAVVASVPERNIDDTIDDPEIFQSRHARNRDEHNDASDGENGLDCRRWSFQCIICQRQR